MWGQRIPPGNYHDQLLPRMWNFDGFRTARGTPAHRDLSFVRKGVRVRGRDHGLLSPGLGPVGAGHPLGRGGVRDGRHRRRARVRGVRVPSFVPGRQGRVARGDLPRLRDHDGLRSETRIREAREGAGTTRTIRRGRASEPALPKVRGSPAVLHRGRRHARGGVRSVREPVHVAPTHRQRGRRWGRPRSTAVRKTGVPVRSGVSTSLPGPSGRPRGSTVPRVGPSWASSIQRRR